MVRLLDPVGYLKLFRFPLVFTAIADSATGYLLTSESRVPSRFILNVGLTAVSSACLYAFGMALNDWSDKDRDKVLAPGRVLPSGRISSSGALIALIVLVIISGFAIALVDGRGSLLQRLVVWGFLLTCIVIYDCVMKAPPVMGLVRALNFILGMAVAAPLMTVFLPWHLALVAMPEFVYVTALTYVSTLEEESLDRRRLWVGTASMILGAFMAATWNPILQGFIPWGATRTHVPWKAFLVSLVLALWISERARRARDKRGVMLLVRDGIIGIILLHTSELSTYDLNIEAACIAALVIPAALSVAVFKRLA